MVWTIKCSFKEKVESGKWKLKVNLLDILKNSAYVPFFEVRIKKSVGTSFVWHIQLKVKWQPNTFSL